MEFAYFFGYPYMQRVLAISEAVGNLQSGEKYQVDYRGTLVDKQEYAFKQIVIGRKNIVNPGDKELFQEISKAMLQTPAVGDRLYKQIPIWTFGLIICHIPNKLIFQTTPQIKQHGNHCIVSFVIICQCLLFLIQIGILPFHGDIFCLSRDL